MRKLVFLAIVLVLVLSGCVFQAPVEETTAETTAASTAKTTELTSASTEGPAPAAPQKYSLAEINENFDPGPATVNKLNKRFGTPKKIECEIENANGYCIIRLEYEGVSFMLVDSIDSPLIPEPVPDGQAIVLTEADMDFPMRVFRTTVDSMDFEVARGIRIGDSEKKVRDAYPSVPRELEDGGLWYRYYNPNYPEGDSYFASLTFGITYTFQQGKLAQVEIDWVDFFDAFD